MIAPPATAGAIDRRAVIYWTPSAPSRFRIKDCGDCGGVVYDIIAGDTHVVDPTAMELLQMLREDAPRTTASLVAGVIDLFDNETEAAVADAVDQGLAHLRRLELVVGTGL